MKFTCTKENLLHALDVVSPLAQKHINLPILMNVHIEALESGVEISTTNLEVALKAHVRARVETTGTFTVPAKTITDFVKLITHDSVDLSLEENELRIKAGSSKTKIKGIPSEEYPVLPRIEEQHAYSLDVTQFKDNISRTIVAVAKNEIRPELSGIFCNFFGEQFQGLVMAATDSYRLAETQTPIAQGSDENVTCIIPARVGQEMNRLLQIGKNHDGENTVRLWVSENQIALRYDTFEMTSRLIDGTYPDYTQIVPNEFKTTAHVSKDALVNKIKAASLFTTVGVNAVSIDLNASENTIGISSTSTQTGEHTSSIDAEISGEENSILLNHRYVLEGLNHITTENITFLINSKEEPCMITPSEGTGFFYIVMPIRQ